MHSEIVPNNIKLSIMKQIVKFEVFLSNEKSFVKTQPVHVFERCFTIDEKNTSDDVFKMKCDFEWHVRNFVNACREVYSQVYVNKSVVIIDFDFDMV